MYGYSKTIYIDDICVEKSPACYDGYRYDYIPSPSVSASFKAEVLSYNTYDPFGMLVPNRSGGSESYRYGFGGQEKDDEIKGEGNSLNYTYRMHDPRVGRFFAPDPLSSKYPWYSPYQFAGNKVIQYGELEGLEETAYTMSLDRKFGSKAYLNMSTAQRNEERKGQAMASTLALTSLIDIYVTKGWLSRTATAYFMGDLAHSAQMQTHYRDQGNEGRAKTYEKEGADASKVLILGLLAEGTGYGIGKVTRATKNWTGKFENSNVVNDKFVDAGYFPPYKADITLGVIKTPEEINGLVRLSGPNNVKGDWITTAKEVEGLTAAQMKDKFSLKHTPTLITPVSIQPNSTIRVGEAAAVKEFSTDGGGFQIEVLDGKVNYGKSSSIK